MKIDTVNREPENLARDARIERELYERHSLLSSRLRMHYSPGNRRGDWLCALATFAMAIVIGLMAAY